MLYFRINVKQNTEKIKKTEFWQIFYFQKTRKSPASRGLSLIAQDIILVLYPPEATFLQSSTHSLKEW